MAQLAASSTTQLPRRPSSNWPWSLRSMAMMRLSGAMLPSTGLAG
jgi:hypothetical protein